MRIKRGKKYRKLVSHFKVVFKFKPPYRVLVDGGFLHYAIKNNDFDLRGNLHKIIEDFPLLTMTKCLMREIEALARENKDNAILKQCLLKAKGIHKVPCKHEGGILEPDECIENFVSHNNAEQVFVGTQDNVLKNKLRNMGSVPIFFFRNQVLIMDTPSQQFEQKMALKAKLKLEPTVHEKAFLKSQREVIKRVKHEE